MRVYIFQKLGNSIRDQLLSYWDNVRFLMEAIESRPLAD